MAACPSKVTRCRSPTNEATASNNLPALGNKIEGFVGINRYIPVLEGPLDTAPHKKFLEEALAAKEAFITSATVFVQAVVSVDGKKVANGKPGPMTDRLREIYLEFAKATAV